MSVDLSLYIESLQREVTPLGVEVDAGISEETWVGHLTDAFWEARLDGFLKYWTCSDDGVVTAETGTSDITRDKIALIILYAGIRILRIQVLNTQAAFRAKAGPVEYETEAPTGMLTEMLKQLKGLKERLLEQAAESVTDSLVDGYTVRQLCPGSYGGFISDIYAGIN